MAFHQDAVFLKRWLGNHLFNGLGALKIKTQDLTIFAPASALVTMIICMHRRVKSARNDGTEKQSLGGWGYVVHSGNVNAKIIQSCSREDLSYADLQLFRLIPRMRKCCQTSTVCKFATNRRINTKVSSTTRVCLSLLV